jgi:hypothetical protein
MTAERLVARHLAVGLSKGGRSRERALGNDSVVSGVRRA